MGAVARLDVVGREGELEQLAAWIADLSEGRGHAALIEGEAGIGKTALAREACDRAADHGCQILWGAGHELAKPLLLSPLLEAFAIESYTEETDRRSIVELLNGTTMTASSSELVAAV